MQAYYVYKKEKVTHENYFIKERCSMRHQIERRQSLEDIWEARAKE
jgi:hypothetical protein